jgi:CO dehydrogenase/acetyl-CoA synthase alpha subunit
MTFKKQLIAFSVADYDKAVADAQEKIKRLYSALNWTAKYILVEHIKLNEFMDDPMKEFMRVFAEKWKVKYPDIKPSKLAVLLDVPLEELSALKERYMAIKQPIKVSKGVYVANVSKDTYSIFTRNEKENKLLAQVNKLMAVVNEIEEDNKVYKMTLSQAMPNVLAFNMRTQELGMKPQYFR